MKLKIAVTDANIFIDLFNLGLTDSFFQLNFEIHTTSAVLFEFEFYEEQIKSLKNYQARGFLEIHNLLEKDFIEIFEGNYPRSLTEADKSVLHIANKLNALVLSSDKTVRNCAKNKGIAYHGMIWIFDQMVETSIINPFQAKSKLQELVATNRLFRDNPILNKEIEKRLKKWET